MSDHPKHGSRGILQFDSPVFFNNPSAQIYYGQVHTNTPKLTTLSVSEILKQARSHTHIPRLRIDHPTNGNQCISLKGEDNVRMYSKIKGTLKNAYTRRISQ